ncbi:hypothetical protein N7447_010655 [Penicillium robsamsonii]|uniref:uncharacterized protein n=1 Tax=Penicillium robsamsonii TaxID=1792511 RepID=UPI0025465D09|nr:uncharacterized protein N7447_010655 [Penicillium robsamsonii]KAJ5811139.1 hypothetical protein N7447_010655 [Penicillium robsamsonii]
MPFIEKNSGFKSIDDYMGLNTIEQSKYHRWCKDNFEFGNYGFTNWIVHFNRGYENDQVKSGLLENVFPEYTPALVKLTINIFCCSAFPAHVEAREFQEAIQDHPRNAEMLTALSSSFVENYFSHGGLENLLCGIDLVRTVIQQAPENDIKRAKRLAILGEGLLRKYGRDGKKETEKEAKRYLDQAVLSTPTGHPDRAYVLNQHSNCLWSLCSFHYDREYIDRAIQESREAVDITNNQFDISMALASVLCHRG